MKYTNILSKIGLSELESKVYLDLLENGVSSIIDISSRTKFHRPIIYKLIPVLKESGLISEVLKGKRKVFKAESPEHLKNLFDNLSKNFNYMIPELQDIYEATDSRPSIKILEGKKGIKDVFEDILITLKKGETYYRYSSRTNFEGFLPSNYKEIRDKKQIQRLIITSENKSKTKTSSLDREVVYIPKSFDLFEDNIAKMIYANKIAIIDYNTMTSFIIENKLLAKFEEKVFKILFKFLRGMGDGKFI
ncbi:MAG: helix-turn-helix domain-containing protein [Candidatus Gracilibacteria bacterium]|nr:helix-turn-helix domain-containing protein [Candidatus Gracilibacteria bacterium]MDD2909265.1 helix-turn-helix domain-containing protein [Candidatus Gracilibacteria bacterium]